MYNTDKNVAALHIRGEKRKVRSVRSRFSAKQRCATLRRAFCRNANHRLVHRDRTDQDYEDYEGRTANRPFPLRENFSRHLFSTSVSRGGSAFAPQALSLQEKISWKRNRENKKSKEKRMYRNRGGCRERETTRREKRGQVGALIVWYTTGRYGGRNGGSRRESLGGSGKRMIKKDRFAIRRDCSLSPRIVRRCRCFSLFLYLVVPFPNFTLQIPLLTLTKVDAVVIHLANLLQLHYKEDGESLRNFWFPRYVCFSDSLANERHKRSERRTARAIDLAQRLMRPY